MFGSHRRRPGAELVIVEAAGSDCLPCRWTCASFPNSFASSRSAPVDTICQGVFAVLIESCRGHTARKAVFCGDNLEAVVHARQEELIGIGWMPADAPYTATRIVLDKRLLDVASIEQA